MARVARGKALVAKLRAQAGVRDPEALAAWLGRFKKARKAGMSAAEAAQVARGGDSSNGSSKPSSTGRSGQVPRSADEAANEIVRAFIRTGDERVKSDKALQEKIRTNYKRQFKGSIEDVPEQKRRDVANAISENERNAFFTDVESRFGRGVVVVKATDRSAQSEDMVGAGGEQRGPITLLYSDTGSKLEDWPGSQKSRVKPGGPTVGDSLSDTLRHEYGHFIDHKAGNISTDSAFRKLLPDAAVVKRDLSYYAGLTWAKGNAQEVVPELFVLVSAPNFDQRKIPESMRPAADYLRERLKKGPRRG